VTAVAVPDFCSPLVGWRAWHAVAHRGDIYLVSVFHRVRWPLLEALVGDCHVWHAPWRKHGHHAAPGLDCKCGIYASSLETASVYARPYPRTEWSRGSAWPVVGTVSLWGDVIEYTDGWRASLAYPTHLFVPTAGRRRQYAHRVVDELGRYGVPVDLVDAAAAEDVVGALATA